MTAAEIKKQFARHFQDKYVIANELRDLAASDIVAIDRDLNMREFEIKVTGADLRRELAEIDYVLAHNPPRGYLSYPDNKKKKHDLYLNGSPKNYEWLKMADRFFCPSTFSFLISRKLYEKEKYRLKRLPYGVMDSETFKILKPAKHLKEAQKATAGQLWKVAHNQNYKLIERSYDEE